MSETTLCTPFQLLCASEPAHYDSFKNLLQEYAERDLADPKQSSIWRDMAQLPGRYAPPHGQVLLAYRDGELAGCGAFVASLTPSLAEIKRIYIRPNFRRQGLARVLTLALAEQARQNAFQTAGICTWAHNTAALALYQQLGFVPIESFREPDKAHLIFLGLPLAQADAT
ncbi:MAG: GCN5-like protein N-acetyltransferase [Comamonadaceae bacterium]|nr:MAG: GCN5-like protein N-acetyltransferase [Comamonadaceae bacterium]